MKELDSSFQTNSHKFRVPLRVIHCVLFIQKSLMKCDDVRHVIYFNVSHCDHKTLSEINDILIVSRMLPIGRQCSSNSHVIAIKGDYENGRCEQSGSFIARVGILNSNNVFDRYVAAGCVSALIYHNMVSSI